MVRSGITQKDGDDFQENFSDADEVEDIGHRVRNTGGKFKNANEIRIKEI